MSNLITAAEFKAFRDISKKVDEDKVNECISLAQQSDLSEILGDFYFDVVKNAEETDYTDLMDGSDFEYCDEDFQHKGIKSLLADYTYARYIYMANVNLTPFGATTKKSNDSEPIDRNTLRDLAKQSQIDAGRKFKYIKKYILSEPVLFSRYCSGHKQGGSFSSARFSKL